MIAKCSKTSSISDTLKYIENKNKGGEIVMSSCFSEGMPLDLQIAVMENASRDESKYKFHHIVLSHKSCDNENVKHIGEKKILIEWLKRMKSKGTDFDKTEWLIVRHGKQNDNLHYHMVALTTNHEGKYWNAAFIGKNATRAAVEVSIQNNLSCAKKAIPYKIRNAYITANSEKFNYDELDDTINRTTKYVNRKERIAAAKARKEELEKTKTQDEIKMPDLKQKNIAKTITKKDYGRSL